MRKADYAALAAIIKQKRQEYLPVHGLTRDEASAKAVSDVAHAFADRASVDKAEFLKACGID